MKLVVDANILFSFFRKDSPTRKLILTHQELALFTPAYVLEELDEHREEVKAKAGIDDTVFEITKKEMSLYITVLGLDRFRELWGQAKKISPDPDDTQYFSTALALKCGVWSNDKKLKEQDGVRIYTTKELIELLAGTNNQA